VSWSSDGNSVRVETDRDVHVAGHLVLALGPWLADQVPEFAPHVTVHRQVQFWFDAGDAAPAFRQMPVFIWMHGSEANQYFYGFPSLDGRTVKVATEQFSTPTTPASVDRTVTATEIREMFLTHVQGHLEGLGPSCLQTAVCLYTATKDFGFLIDRHPLHGNVFVASPCSGHGFKHSAAIGEAIAQSVLGEQTTCSLQKFSLDRFEGSS
jgi:sarcosine oxidase